MVETITITVAKSLHLRVAPMGNCHYSTHDTILQYILDNTLAVESCPFAPRACSLSPSVDTRVYARSNWFYYMMQLNLRIADRDDGDTQKILSTQSGAEDQDVEKV